MERISIRDLYNRYRSQGYSHFDAVRKITADARQMRLIRELKL